MAVIHHDQGVIFLGQITDLSQFGNISIHGKHAVSDDQPDTGILGIPQALLQLLHVAVSIAQTLRFAQADTINDRGMVKRV